MPAYIFTPYPEGAVPFSETPASLLLSFLEIVLGRTDARIEDYFL